MPLWVVRRRTVDKVMYSKPVLVVDDDPLFRILMHDALKTLGVASVLEAEDGTDVLDILQDQKAPVGLIFLDLSMPKVSGQTVLGCLADIKFHGDVIICSGESGEAIKRAEYLGKVLGISIVGSMVKPIDMERLAHLIGQCAGPAGDSGIADDNARRLA